MERNVENELMEIKREIAGLRDKAVSSKAMMSSAETQIKDHLASLTQLIDEGRRQEFVNIAECLQNDLTSPEASADLNSWIEDYTQNITAANIAMIDKIKLDIANWKTVMS